MKINSINQQSNNKLLKQNFNGKMSIFDKTAKVISDHPGWVATLAGSSVVAQKIVMSGSEAVVGPAMDIGIGKAITKITDEKDNRTNESSKVQAIRTFSQSTGGTIVGVAIRLACIAALTAVCTKAGQKAGSKLGQKITEGKDLSNKFAYADNMEKWGKSLGGMVATGVMLFTNFIIDAPFINWINTKATNVVDKITKKDATNQEKGVK